MQSSIDDCAKADLIVRFLAAMWAANLYLNDSLTKECATKAIQAQLNVTAATAALEYAAATNSVTGEISGGIFEVNQLGLNNIIAVRQEFGGFSVPAAFDFAAATAPGPGKLIDYSLRNEAFLLLKPELLSIGC